MSTNLVRNNRPPARLEDSPIHPEQIVVNPTTILNVVINHLRNHFPAHKFKIQQVTENEAVITHTTKDYSIEFFRVKVSR